jgi:UDP-glucose:glycoprotein glucosyltransferase
MTSTAASIVAAVHIPDPTEAGLFKMPLRPRQRGYRQLLAQNSYGIHLHGHDLHSLFLCRRISLGDEKNALYHFAVLIDPVSEITQKWGPLLLVSHLLSLWNLTYGDFSVALAS